MNTKEQELRTPLTDAAIKTIDVAFDGYDGLSSSPEQWVDPDFARDLERKLAAAQKRIAELEATVAGYRTTYCAQQEKAEAENAALRAKAEALANSEVLTRDDVMDDETGAWSFIPKLMEGDVCYIVRALPAPKPDAPAQEEGKP